jgi:hypothetical protein
LNQEGFLADSGIYVKVYSPQAGVIEQSAAGMGRDIRGMQAGGSVADFGEHPDRIHSPGPNASQYEQFHFQAGAHLIFNACWTIQHFCVHQMLRRDPMHQIDLRAIVHRIRAILRKFKECVDTALDMPGLAARILRQPLEIMLAKRTIHGGQK